MTQHEPVCLADALAPHNRWVCARSQGSGGATAPFRAYSPDSGGRVPAGNGVSGVPFTEKAAAGFDPKVESGDVERTKKEVPKVNTAKIAKIAGLLLLIGPLVDLLVSISRPGSFPSDHADGPQAVMQAGVQSAASNGTFVQLLVDVGFIASFGLLFGFWCVDRFMSSDDGRAHLRKAGLMILGIALAVRTASFAMGLLLATTINFAPAGALDAGTGLDTAVMFLVMEGSFSVFATILNLAGVALFATSVMNAGLMGSNNLLTGLLVIVPAVVGPFLLLLAPFLDNGIFAVFRVGNLVALVQVLWIVVVGAVLINKSDSLAMAA